MGEIEYIDLYESFNITELQLIKHALETAQIEFIVLNETLLHAGNLEAMGYSGARVQVNALKFKSASQVLASYNFNINSQEEVLPFVLAFNSFTEKIPLLRQISPPFRIVAIVFLLTIIAFIIIWFTAT